jgi:gamma-glutamyltranspeptidase/glutathione hydrolase
MKTPRAALLLTLLFGCGTAPTPEPLPPALPTATASASASAPAASACVAPTPPPVVLAPGFPAGWPYPADAAPVTGQHGMVVTDAALATKVGLEMLKAGGNAVDAAVATAFALAVVYPGAGNLGGGGFLVARVDGAPHSLDFRETAPSKATHDTFAPPAAGKGPAKPEDKGGTARVGHLASGVPGSVAGLWEAHQKLGSKKKTWAEVLAPAIKLAEEGFVVDARSCPTGRWRIASAKLASEERGISCFLASRASRSASTSRARKTRTAPRT